MRVRDIAIAGCGVAGLAAAALLRRQGARVTLFDRLDEPRPLGSGLILQPVGLAVLDEIGAGTAIRALGAPIERLFGKSGKHIVLDVRYDALGKHAPRRLSVHRGALFQVLYDAAQASGAAFETRREIVAAADSACASPTDTKARASIWWSMRSAHARRCRGCRRKNLAYGALWASLEWAGAFDAAALEQRYEAAQDGRRAADRAFARGRTGHGGLLLEPAP
ncbi:MAG: FAD-dependent monooxygenase [Hyphomonadaceae bacterium]